MNVGQLREALKDMPDEFIVVLAKDAEGNNFSPLSDPEDAYYRAETTWYGEYYGNLEDAEDVGAEPAVFLWPVN
jgi:hypothetical protein